MNFSPFTCKRQVEDSSPTSGSNFEGAGSDFDVSGPTPNLNKENRFVSPTQADNGTVAVDVGDRKFGSGSNIVQKVRR